MRLASRGKPESTIFSQLDISGVRVVSRRLLSDYFVLENDGDRHPFQTAKKIFESPLFDYVEFDARGTFSSTPQDSGFTG